MLSVLRSILMSMVVVVVWFVANLDHGNRARERAASVSDSKYFASDANALPLVAEWRACVDALPESADPIVGCPAHSAVAKWIAARSSEYMQLDRSWPLSYVDRHWPQPVWAERLHAAGTGT